MFERRSSHDQLPHTSLSLFWEARVHSLFIDVKITDDAMMTIQI